MTRAIICMSVSYLTSMSNANERAGDSIDYSSWRLNELIFFYLFLSTHFIISLLLTGEPLNEPTVVNKQNMRLFDWSPIRVQDANMMFVYSSCTEMWISSIGISWILTNTSCPLNEILLCQQSDRNHVPTFLVYIFIRISFPSAALRLRVCDVIIRNLYFFSYHFRIVSVFAYGHCDYSYMDTIHTMDIGHTKQVWRKKTTRRMLTIETRNV